LFSVLNEVMASLSINTTIDEVCVKRGERVDGPLQFTVFFEDEPAEGIPVSFSYSGGYLKDNISISDETGLTFVDPGTIISRNEQEQITATIKLNNIANNATDDLFIRGLFDKQDQITTTAKISISLPGCAISIDDKFCMFSDCERIKRVFVKNALNEGYRFDTVDLADYVFHINLHYDDGESAGGLTSLYLQGNLKLLNTSSELIWTKDISVVKGVGQSKEEAKEEAFEILLKNLDLIYFRQGLAAID